MTAVYLRRLDLSIQRTPAELTAFRSAEVRRLLADCLKARFSEREGAWSLAKTAEGKPYLASTEGKPPQISLSHSGNWVVCALSDAPIGVDVQEVRTISDAVVRRYLPDVTPESDDRVKTCAWTRYEACLKRYGSAASMMIDAQGQKYDCYTDLSDAIVTVCHGDDAVEWILN